MNPFSSRTPTQRIARRARRLGKDLRSNLRPLTQHFTPASRIERAGDWIREQADRVDIDKVGDSFQRATQHSGQVVRDHPLSLGAGLLALIGAALGFYSMRKPTAGPAGPQHKNDEFHRVIETPGGVNPSSSNPIERYPLSTGILAVALGVAAAIVLRDD